MSFRESLKVNDGKPVKISQSILYEKLTGNYTFEVFGAKNSDLVFEWPLFLRDGGTLKDNQIYLAKDGMTAGKPARKLHSILLYTGSAAEDFIPFFDAAFVFRDIPLFDLYDVVRQIYSEYESWDEALRDILVSGGGIQEMLDKSTRIFNNPLVFYDKEFSTVIYNAEFAGALDCGERRSPYPAVFASPCHSGGPHSIYANISLRGKPRYRLMALEFFRKLAPGDNALLEYLANAIHLMVNGTAGTEEIVTSLPALLRNILAGGYAEAHVLDRRMTEYNWRKGWQKDHKLIWIRVPGTGPETVRSANALCVKIRELFPNSCVFEYAGGAAALVNLEYFENGRDLPPAYPGTGAAARNRSLLRRPDAPAAPERKPFREKRSHGNKIIALAGVLDDLLEREDLKAGFSDVFSGTAAIREYYRQAEFALSLGIKRGSPGRIFYFGDVKEFLLLDNCLGELPASMVCAPELLALRDYDRKHNTPYYETFYRYLRNNLSPARTIRELNIHRSTLLYRLEKIQAITGLDAPVGDRLWYFLLSYKLLEYAGGYGGI